jgi:hypothetical protein
MRRAKKESKRMRKRRMHSMLRNQSYNLKVLHKGFAKYYSAVFRASVRTEDDYHRKQLKLFRIFIETN